MAAPVPVANAAFLNANQHFFEEQKYWFECNNHTKPLPPEGNPPVPTNAEFQASWRTTPFARGPIPMMLRQAPQRAAPTPMTRALINVNPPPETAAEFLDRIVLILKNLRPRFAPRGIGEKATNWKGVKILGKGGSATVSLWEWSSRAKTRPTIDQKRIAVKSITNAVPDLEDEGNFMVALGRARSQHIARILAPPNTLTREDCAREGLDVATWEGIVKRLILEYYPLGTLRDLKKRRRERDFPFQELTLWRIFKCLVDGCSVLSYEQELKVNLRSQAVVPRRAPAEVLVHFDLKSENIFAGTTDDKHFGLPVYKLGDFGLAETFDINPANVIPTDDYEVDENLRERGTKGWLAPEQFTPRWYHSDFLGSPVCGRYGTATNVSPTPTTIWDELCSISICETFAKKSSHNKIICLYMNGPKPTRPFDFVNPDRPTATTFGDRLNEQLFSTTLKNLILECLYEIPANRPTLAALKSKITAVIVSCKAAGFTEDKWYEMELPDEQSVRAAETDAAIALEAARLPVAPVAGNRKGRFRKATLKVTRGGRPV
ncbi:hypothetical protein DL98DRAFT_534802 [Cadophora sp. DSE1049]|nr:hypothetical protein DL98DRAFT_534802 [Cadophora sp. DSE1049]